MSQQYKRGKKKQTVNGNTKKHNSFAQTINP